MTSKQANRAIQDAYNVLVDGAPPMQVLWVLQNLYKRAFADGVEYGLDRDSVVEPIDHGDMP